MVEPPHVLRCNSAEYGWPASGTEISKVWGDANAYACTFQRRRCDPQLCEIKHLCGFQNSATLSPMSLPFSAPSVTLRTRLLVGVGSAGTGWIGGMFYLAAAESWAFRTEFGPWAVLTGMYAAFLLAVITGWIAHYRWSSLWKLVVIAILQFGAAATFLPFCLAPFTGGMSIVLLVTGQAYPIAAIAAMMYLSITIIARSGRIQDSPRA